MLLLRPVFVRAAGLCLNGRRTAAVLRLFFVGVLAEVRSIEWVSGRSVRAERPRAP
jgi:hypothetical protein